MKQRIDESQLNSLSSKSKEKLIVWSKTCISFQEECDEGDYDRNVPLLSIGQMIEFLDEDNRFELIDHCHFKHGTGWKDILWDNKQELCDSLWMNVKEILESEAQ